MELTELFDQMPFVEHLGIEVTEAGSGYAEARLPFSEELILVAVILSLTSLCYLRIQTRSAWILNSSFHVRTATSITIITMRRFTCRLRRGLYAYGSRYRTGR